nr:DDE-type integrase/transposase/recombinase [Methylobacterium radiodurans]
MVCAVRRATGFPLDDLTAVVTQFLPHLNRDAVYRILKAEGLNRLPQAERGRRPVNASGQGTGRVRFDVTPLATDEPDGGRFLYVAVDHAARCAHLALKDDETTASAVGFLKEALEAFPSRVTHVLTDHDSCFAAHAFTRACDTHALEHRRIVRADAQRSGARGFSAAMDAGSAHAPASQQEFGAVVDRSAIGGGPRACAMSLGLRRAP